MKRIIMIIAAVAVTMSLTVACEKGGAEQEISNGQEPETEVDENTFSVAKELWKEATKASKSDVDWQVGDEVTIYTEDGKYHSFHVKESHGMNAVFDCDKSFWDNTKRYKIYYPSLGEGWLFYGGYILTYGYHPQNSVQKVGDWMASDWVRPNEGRHLSFILKHLSSMVTLTIKHPQAGRLMQCYLHTLPLDWEAGKTQGLDNYDRFGYKIAFDFDGNDFVLDLYSKCSSFPLMFDKTKTFALGETMVEDTPMYNDELEGVECSLILVYADGGVWAAPIELCDLEVGGRHSISPSSSFVKFDKEPYRSWRW